MSEYDIQAQDFLEKTGTTITKEFVDYKKYPHNDKEPRNVWSITIKNKEWEYTFEFGDSITNSAKFTIDDSLKNPALLKNLLKYVDKNNVNINLKHWDDSDINNVIRTVFYSDFQQYNVKAHLKYLQEIPPSDYSILACLDVLYSDSFEEFCSEFWYDTDSRSAYNIYIKCIEQDRMLRRIFDKKQLEMLAEIQ